jgi:branched-chain amino acid transport system substrate-binding protein
MAKWIMKIVAILVLAFTICLSGVVKAADAPPKGGAIKVGAIFARTGGAANLGEPEAKTAEMLVEKINKQGGVNGKKLELIIKD